MPKVFNLQPIEKHDHEAPLEGLDVHSIFPTIQGEGPFVGQPAIFIRLAGCNLQCPLCDTDYTEGRSRLSIPAIYDTVLENQHSFRPLIVITGGEPFRQANLSQLVRFLIGKDFRVQIETNGSLWQEDFAMFPDSRVTVVCSPKSGKLNSILAMRANAYKYVVKAGDIDYLDGLPIHALDHPVGKRVARPPMGYNPTKIYVQPADTQDEAENQSHLQAAIQSCRQFGYTLCIQTHKIINLP